MKKRAIRAPYISFQKDSFTYESDGQILLDEKGKIAGLGPYHASDEFEWEMYSSDYLLLPGFVDCHLHYPQTEMIGSFGETLLEWLTKYTFQVEQKYSELTYATEQATFFVEECLKSGTTTAMVFSTKHPSSVDALFSVASKYNWPVITGKVLMDRNAPEALLDQSAGQSIEESEHLLKKWHGNNRAHYAITPRFLPTSTPEQLEGAGQLWKKYQAKGVYLQSHLSENESEVAWVKELFPQSKDYFHAYEQYGLVGPRSMYAHAIHLTEREKKAILETGTALAHSPSSNLFLGSGLFSHRDLDKHLVGLASDVGAGTSFSLLKNMGDAYKVSVLNKQPMAPLKAFYMATLGGAKALHLDHEIGSLEVGKYADLQVLNLKATPLLSYRLSRAESLEELLFVLMTLGDERLVSAVYLAGLKCKFF